jgi:CPA2 family monovalent cation:H+ antiporter-2
MLPDEVDQAYLRDQVVIVGYGEVGRRITKTLMEQNIQVVIAEENREIVEKLRKKGIAAVSGEATEPNVLIQAHIMHARLLVIITHGYFRHSSYCRYCQTAESSNSGALLC